MNVRKSNFVFSTVSFLKSGIVTNNLTVLVMRLSLVENLLVLPPEESG